MRNQERESSLLPPERKYRPIERGKLFEKAGFDHNITAKLKFINPLIFKNDPRHSKQFYAETLDRKCLRNDGSLVQFEGKFGLLRAAATPSAIYGREG